MISNVRIGTVGGNFVNTFAAADAVIRYFSKFNDGRVCDSVPTLILLAGIFVLLHTVQAMATRRRHANFKCLN